VREHITSLSSLVGSSFLFDKLFASSDWVARDFLMLEIRFV
jgi:hypothetical protein